LSKPVTAQVNNLVVVQNFEPGVDTTT